MSLFAPLSAEKRRKIVYGVSAVVICVFVGLGVFAKNGWLPKTDPLSGKKTGWFGQELPKNAGSTWNPLAAPLPTATPQLSKEYIYAGQRLLTVEDANANAAPPADLAVWREDGQFIALDRAGNDGALNVRLLGGNGSGAQHLLELPLKLGSNMPYAAVWDTARARLLVASPTLTGGIDFWLAMLGLEGER